MQQTLQQAMQRDVALQKCDITLHAFLSTLVKNRLERENDIEHACRAACSTACSTACCAVSRF
jgi:hypothetical protein